MNQPIKPEQESSDPDILSKEELAAATKDLVELQSYIADSALYRAPLQLFISLQKVTKHLQKITSQ